MKRARARSRSNEKRIVLKTDTLVLWQTKKIECKYIDKTNDEFAKYVLSFVSYQNVHNDTTTNSTTNHNISTQITTSERNTEISKDADKTNSDNNQEGEPMLIVYNKMGDDTTLTALETEDGMMQGSQRA